MTHTQKFTTAGVALIAIAALVFAYMPVTASAGNGAPSGAHYTLNIIGVPKGNNGRRIFVPDTGKTKILLTEGDFQVLDANGTDPNGASFSLPNPDPNGDGVTDYSVYVRALGKPWGSANMQTCYTDSTGTWCAVDFADGVSQITISRSTGKSTFTNVSKDLLYLDYCAAWTDTNLDGEFTSDECTDVDQVPLFGVVADEFYWDYDNFGLKLAQLRFYQESTDTGWVNE